MDNKPVTKPIIFLDYDKISDILLWFSPSKYQLKFSVILKKKDNNGNTRPFHTEYSFYNSISDKNGISIKRDYKFFFSIEKSSGDLDDNIILKPNDIEILKIQIKDIMYPWFFGTKNVYGIDSNNNLCLKKPVKPFQFVISSISYISFEPIVYYYENSNDTKQGVKIEINKPENSFEISIDVFLHFTSIILNTDMVNAAMNMLNYVKSKPYGINTVDLSQNENKFNRNNYTYGKGFFDK